jgi:molybdate transport system substrate-binding protein
MATSPAQQCVRLRAVAALAALVGAAAVGPAVPATAADNRAAAVQPAAGGLLVFAAASLSEALGEADNAFTAGTGIPMKASFAASSVLAKQIEAGAPADVFFSADREWMDYLEQRALLKPGSRRDLLGNALVLIAPADSSVRLKIAPHFELAAALGNGRLATGDPDSVPAGRYARAALMHFGVWEQVANRLARAENVRAALEYVAHGEVPLGIVYRTDAQAETRVRVVDVFPADSHPAITYPLALTTVARLESARFAEFISSDAAREIFVRRGFVVLDSRPQPN